jgi:hypothetical protein
MLQLLMPVIVELALKLIAAFVQNKVKQQEYQKAVIEAAKRYQRGVLDSAKAREADKALDEKLEALWQAKWGTPPPPPPEAPPPTTDAYRWYIDEGPFKGETEFAMPFGDLPVGSAIYAEQKWILGYVTKGAVKLTLKMSGAGRREIRAKLPDGTWTAPRYLVIL